MASAATDQVRALSVTSLGRGFGTNAQWSNGSLKRESTPLMGTSEPTGLFTNLSTSTSNVYHDNGYISLRVL
jgi:hypothetical protein